MRQIALDFIVISGVVLFWKVVKIAIDEIAYRNNRD